MPAQRPFGQPGREGLPGAALDHVQQPGRAGAGAYAGEVDDHGDELVAAPGVPPCVLVDADHLDAVEPARITDQHALALSQDRVVGGVPRHRERFGDAGDGQVLADDAFQRPPQAPARQPRPRLGRPAGVLAPHAPAAGAPVAADRDQQCRRPPAQRFVRQPTGHRVPRRTLCSAAPAPPVQLVRIDPAGQHRPVGLPTLTNDLQAEFVQAAECTQIRAHEGSVRHVEVFRLGGAGTPIIGRPRRLPTHRRAARRCHAATPQIG